LFGTDIGSETVIRILAGEENSISDVYRHHEYIDDNAERSHDDVDV
jgi:hypothetical protein